jgi:hypothetical protein
VAIGEGDAGHIPEDEHKAELFVVHIPVRKLIYCEFLGKH